MTWNTLVKRVLYRDRRPRPCRKHGSEGSNDTRLAQLSRESRLKVSLFRGERLVLGGLPLQLVLQHSQAQR